MKNQILIILYFLSILTYSYGQLGAAPTGEEGLFNSASGGNPMLNLVFSDLRNKKEIKTSEKPMGSPYLNDAFQKSKVYYDNELIGDYFIRFNALNSEIELKEYYEQKEIKKLVADKKISVQYQNREIRFTTYINKKKQTKNGYLSNIHSGKSYKLFHRLAIKYVEGKAAANSMVNSVPSRYVKFEEFYYQEKGINRIDQLNLKKSKLLKQIKKEFKEPIKIYLKENNIDLNKEDQLIELFTYLNTL